MPRKSKAQRLSELHALALDQFDDSYNATSEDRQRAQLARRFVNIRGAQWDWDENDDFRNRIKFEIDQVSQACVRIKNEYRKNRIAAQFLPSDGSAGDALSDACAGRYRADTLNAYGKEARDAAFDNAVEGGFGGLRLRAEYEDGEAQKICLEAINDPELTLYFDINAKKKDKSDARHAFLVTPWARKAFVREYGEECASWPERLTMKPRFGWFNTVDNIVFVAEYFVKEEENVTFRTFTGPSGEEEEIPEAEADDALVADLLAQGYVEGEARTEERDRVLKYVLNGAKVLEGPDVIPGGEIPLIPQYGQRTVINHVERFRGHVLKAMDAQIVYNLQVSKVAETAASSGIEKPVFTPEQISGHTSMWQDDHRDNNAFLLINPVLDVQGNPMPAGPIAFTKSPEVAPAVAALITLTKQDIADQLGNPENAEQVQPDMSGVAMDLVQGRLDMASYGYMDNAGDAERRVAEIWRAMAAELYVENGRKLKTIAEDGKRGMVEIGKKVQDPKTGQPVAEIDFSKARTDVTVDIGPTSASRRAAIVRAVTGIMSVTPDPQTQVMLSHVALMNLEGEGLTDIRDYSRQRLVAMGVVKPTQEEQAALDRAAQQQQPDPQAELAQALSMEAAAKAQKAQADTALSVARTKEAEANTAETLAGIPIAQQRAAVDTARQIQEGLNGGRDQSGNA